MLFLPSCSRGTKYVEFCRKHNIVKCVTVAEKRVLEPNSFKIISFIIHIPIYFI